MASLPWVTGTALAAITLLEPFPARYRSRGETQQTLSGQTRQLGFYESIRANISWAPPPAVYSIWFVLYVLMAIAHTLWVVNAEPVSSTAHYNAVWIVYFVHLFFNKIWSFLFFGLRSRLGVTLGLVDIVITAALAIAQLVLYATYGAPVLTYVFWSVYLAWVLFASALSVAIFTKRSVLSYGNERKYQ